ncbi:GntR family transcriptional regulator [Streptomyces sp. NPDC021100]|uniref:GntR family transcriptional regulator n=1 Tax=Streptomyces sp. NPDC021100 TaxID=3365114 RepID=UPI00378F5CA9
MPVSYRDIAADLRMQISEGRYAPGDKLPLLTELQKTYGASYQTVRSAIDLLKQEGMVEAIRRRGTIVRERPDKRRITRSRQVFRDEIGYYFDQAAQSWVPVKPPTVAWGTVPIDLAGAMDLSVGSEVLIRDRVMGDPDTREPLQISTSYLPAELARGTRLAEPDTGPGGIYDRLEEMGHLPLSWSESVSSRMPTPDESQTLKLSKGVPVLRITRTTTSPSGQVVEVNDSRVSAELFEVGYDVPRAPSAQAPTPIKA